MALVLDPKVAAIMAKVEEEEMEEAARKKAKPKVKPPTNIEEFLAAEKLVSHSMVYSGVR